LQIVIIVNVRLFTRRTKCWLRYWRYYLQWTTGRYI